MSRLVRVDELRPGDQLQLTRVEPVFVEELVANGDGRIVVRWWRPTGESHMKRRRHMWKHPRRPDGKPAGIRYSLGALQAINEAIDGRQLGSFVPLEPHAFVRLISREERTP